MRVAAGLYLAALYLKEGGTPGGAAASFGGDDRFVSEYVESKFLARISQRQRVFLTRTAVLERLCGPPCEAVLGQRGSASTLDALARSNMLLVPLDRRGQWYRYHHLFRDMLLAELERQEPGLLPVLRRRAAAWYLRHDLPEEALEYSMTGDADAAAPLVEKLWLAADRQGRFATLQRWIRWLDDRNAIEGRPMLAVQAAFVFEAVGRPAEADRWADVVDRWLDDDESRPDDRATEAWAAMLRAAMCRRGAEQMRTDADAAARKFAAQNLPRPAVPLLQGLARVLCGDFDGGDAMLQDAVSTGEQVGAHETSRLRCANGRWWR
jgi:LuxR family maltose regulon positive regulatory protein